MRGVRTCYTKVDRCHVGPTISVAKFHRTADSPTVAIEVRQFIAALPHGQTSFPSPPDSGAAILRRDQGVAGIPSADASARFVGFRLSRCQPRSCSTPLR